jgi:hypothetical protein
MTRAAKRISASWHSPASSFREANDTQPLKEARSVGEWGSERGLPPTSGGAPLRVRPRWRKCSIEIQWACGTSGRRAVLSGKTLPRNGN